MCCPLDCNPDLKPDDWTPCIEFMDITEMTRYRKTTGDNSSWDWVLQKEYTCPSRRSWLSLV